MLESTGKKIQKRVCVLALMTALLSGCTLGPADGGDVVILEPDEQTSYTLTAVTIADVALTHDLRCEYRQVNDEQLAFALDGKAVNKVYVEKGESVEKGQLLAELDTDSIDTDIEDLEYQIRRNKLLLGQVNESQEMEIRILKQQYAGYEQTDEVKKALAEGLAAIDRQYRYQAEDYEDRLEMENRRLKLLQDEKSKAYLRAGMDGTVSYVKDELESAYSKAGEVVLKIIDDSHCVFVSAETQYRDCFLEGQSFQMSISTGKGVGSYEMVPYRMDEWGDEMYFTLEDENELLELEVGRYGTITLNLSERTQVLTIPKEAVHEADGRTYVYVLGDGGVREVHWITIGLYGDSNAEVTDGLQEGDRVILK